MDVGRLSMAMSQNSLMNAVSLSLMKIQMNTSSEIMEGMTKIMETTAVDTSKGNVIDIRV